jgi:hypothetical protein
VVFVAVCENDGGDFVAVLINEREVWDDDVNAGQFFVREAHAGVKDDGLAAAA